MKVPVSTALNRVYVPEWNGNKTLSEVEQIRVLYNAPSVTMKDALFERKFDLVQSDTKRNDKGQPVMEPMMSVTINREKVIRALVNRIENLEATLDGVEVPIKTAPQLFAAGVEFDGLVEELYVYFNDLLNQGINEKN